MKITSKKLVVDKISWVSHGMDAVNKNCVYGINIGKHKEIFVLFVFFKRYTIFYENLKIYEGKHKGDIRSTKLKVEKFLRNFIIKELERLQLYLIES